MSYTIMHDIASIEEAFTQSGRFTILVVEDDTDVRRVVVRMLYRLGYKVLHAESGQRALTVSAMFYGPIDLLLTDVVMPGMNGQQLSEELKRSRPDLKVLYMSGHQTDEFKGDLAIPESHLIQKPFSTEQLAARLRGLLESDPPAS